MKMGDIWDLLKEVFISDDMTETWLNKPNPALGNKKPMDLINTEYGCEQVANILNSIKYGLYS